MAISFYVVAASAIFYFVYKLKQENEVKFKILKTYVEKACCKNKNRNRPMRVMARLARKK